MIICLFVLFYFGFTTFLLSFFCFSGKNINYCFLFVSLDVEEDLFDFDW